MTTTVLKAYGGDRVANLRGLAEAIRREADTARTSRVRIEIDGCLHRLKGYATQLEIIARELENGPPVSNT